MTRISKNRLCSCGSKKKYKRCCINSKKQTTTDMVVPYWALIKKGPPKKEIFDLNEPKTAGEYMALSHYINLHLHAYKAQGNRPNMVLCIIVAWNLSFLEKGVLTMTFEKYIEDITAKTQFPDMNPEARNDLKSKISDLTRALIKNKKRLYGNINTMIRGYDYIEIDNKRLFTFFPVKVTQKPYVKESKGQYVKVSSIDMRMNPKFVNEASQAYS